MTTIVIHGTQTHRNPVHATWWWNSWHEGGFLDAVRRGMESISGSHDLWRVRGVPVSDVPELVGRPRGWGRLFGGRSLTEHNGHFVWGGAAIGIARDAGGEWLAAYLNKLHELSDEPLRIIAHSHGCNIVKLAGASRNLAPAIRIVSAVFLACPHFFTPNAASGYRVTYKFPSQRFGRILNVYCPTDSVQVDIASHLSGQLLTQSVAEMQSPTAFRVDQDPEVDHLYENVELAADCSGAQAHTVMHGALVGEAIGAWIQSNAGFSGGLPPIASDDDGT